MVTDLVAGAGLKFVERGSHQLKGLPGRWTCLRRAYKVCSSEGLSLVPPFAMVCWGSDEWVLRADSAPSLATPVGPLPRSIEAYKAAVCYVRNTSVCDIQSPRTVLRWDWAVITSRSGRSGFEGYEAVDLIRRYPATARRSALLR